MKKPVSLRNTLKLIKTFAKRYDWEYTGKHSDYWSHLDAFEKFLVDIHSIEKRLKKRSRNYDHDAPAIRLLDAKVIYQLTVAEIGDVNRMFKVIDSIIADFIAIKGEQDEFLRVLAGDHTLKVIDNLGKQLSHIYDEVKQTRKFKEHDEYKQMIKRIEANVRLAKIECENIGTCVLRWAHNNPSYKEQAEALWEHFH